MDTYDYFGIPEANLQAAHQFKKTRKNHKFNVDVPSRREVASLAPAELNAVMLNWMCNSVTEIIPSRAQIAEARAILLARADAVRLAELISMCDHYISGE